MKGLALVKRAAGAVVDAVAEVEAEIARLAEVEAKAKGDTLRLGHEWLHCATQTAAEEIDRARVEAQRLLARCAALRPELEQRLAKAKAERQREGLQRHHRAIADFAPALIAAVEAAAAAQVEAIALREAAVRELGEGLVAANIPHLAFRGLLLPDLVQIWARELRRSFEPPSAQPAPAGPAKANGHARPAPTPAPPTPRRPPRADPPPQSDDQRSVVFLRAGVELDGGTPNGGTQRSIIGDQCTMPTEIARRHVLAGNADYLS
jgi:hypothetical protein